MCQKELVWTASTLNLPASEAATKTSPEQECEAQQTDAVQPGQESDSRAVEEGPFLRTKTPWNVYERAWSSTSSSRKKQIWPSLHCRSSKTDSLRDGLGSFVVNAVLETFIFFISKHTDV